MEVTSTIRLGTAVSIPVESDPITLAKTFASVDHLSDGRAVLGVGYGWSLDEMAATTFRRSAVAQCCASTSRR